MEVFVFGGGKSWLFAPLPSIGKEEGLGVRFAHLPFDRGQMMAGTSKSAEAGEFMPGAIARIKLHNFVYAFFLLRLSRSILCKCVFTFAVYAGCDRSNPRDTRCCPITNAKQQPQALAQDSLSGTRIATP